MRIEYNNWNCTLIFTSVLLQSAWQEIMYYSNLQDCFFFKLQNRYGCYQRSNIDRRVSIFLKLWLYEGCITTFSWLRIFLVSLSLKVFCTILGFLLMSIADVNKRESIANFFYFVLIVKINLNVFFYIIFRRTNQVVAKLEDIF